MNYSKYDLDRLKWGLKMHKEAFVIATEAVKESIEAIKNIQEELKKRQQGAIK